VGRCKMGDLYLPINTSGRLANPPGARTSTEISPQLTAFFKRAMIFAAWLFFL
jgi:hypothetical protein